MIAGVFAALALVGNPLDPWDDPEAVAPSKPVPIYAWSTYQLDPDGLTRFSVTSLGMFADQRDAFSGASAWSFEPRVQLRITEGIAIHAVLPIGLSSPSLSRERFAFGNVDLGIVVGGTLHAGEDTRLRLAGGFDSALPTAPALDVPSEARDTVVAAMRAYEPQLYVSKLWSFRFRAHADFTFKALTAEAEVALVPAVLLGQRAQFVMMIGATGRLSGRINEVFEPYLEAGCTPQVAGPGEIAPPFQVTPGLRLHIADLFDPAIFVSFNFIAPSAVIFGVDLASVLRPSTKGESARHRRGGLDGRDMGF